MALITELNEILFPLFMLNHLMVDEMMEQYMSTLDNQCSLTFNHNSADFLFF